MNFSEYDRLYFPSPLPCPVALRGELTPPSDGHLPYILFDNKTQGRRLSCLFFSPIVRNIRGATSAV